MSKTKCGACGDTGMVGVYIGDGEFEFHPCEWCSVYNNQFRPTKRAADSLKAGGKSAKRKVVKAKVIRPAKNG